MVSWDTVSWDTVSWCDDNGSAMLHPLVRGIDPTSGRESIELVKSEVMPLLVADANG